MEGRARRAYRRTSVRRLRETTGQAAVEWLAVMVGVCALAAVLVAVLPGTAPAIVDRFGCLIGAVAGGRRLRGDVGLRRRGVAAGLRRRAADPARRRRLGLGAPGPGLRPVHGPAAYDVLLLPGRRSRPRRRDPALHPGPRHRQRGPQRAARRPRSRRRRGHRRRPRLGDVVGRLRLPLLARRHPGGQRSDGAAADALRRAGLRLPDRARRPALRGLLRRGGFRLGLQRAAGRRRAALGAAGLRGHRPAALAGPCGDRRRVRVQHVVGPQEPQRAASRSRIPARSRT